MYPPFGRDYTIAVKNAIRRTETQYHASYRWLDPGVEEPPSWSSSVLDRSAPGLVGLLPRVAGDPATLPDVSPRAWTPGRDSKRQIVPADASLPRGEWRSGGVAA